jgi:hypothetical protein
MYNKSIKCSNDNIKKTVAKVSQFKADMGCTELNGALNFAYDNKHSIPHVPKLVFLLTDGDVGNPDSIISLARKNSKICRTFTIGVGSGASPYLVR